MAAEIYYPPNDLDERIELTFDLLGVGGPAS
jgi:hypothetical protein